MFSTVKPYIKPWGAAGDRVKCNYVPFLSGCWWCPTLISTIVLTTERLGPDTLRVNPSDYKHSTSKTRK